MARPIPSLAPVTIASLPSRRNDGSSLDEKSAGIRRGSPRASGSFVKRMKFVHQPLVKWVRGVDVDAVRGDDVIVFQANAAHVRIARIGLQVEGHPLFQ